MAKCLLALLGIGIGYATPALGQRLALPERATNALGGTELVQRLAPLNLADREKEICAQVLSGNVPEFLRSLSSIQVTNNLNGQASRATFYVTPDYLAVGSDGDYFLTPLSPNTAQRIADALNCSLPTRKMVNAIYDLAPVKLPPSPLPPSPAMTTVPVFAQHNALVRTQRTEQLPSYPLGTLTAGHKKDVVLTPHLGTAPGKVAIYGWHQTNGTPIQPLYLGHTAAWVDYSQCIRLVQQSLRINEATQTVAAVLTNPALAEVLSDEGVITLPRYPTNALPSLGHHSTNSTIQAKSGSIGFTGFQTSPDFAERTATFNLDPEIRIHINAPAAECFAPTKKVLLIFYALPNGNTLEQTIGRALRPGDDWHYDIQHIGAQTRFVRQLIQDRGIVVAYLENDLKSWPAWRKKYGDKLIPEILTRVRQVFAGQEIEMVLSGHSGGGSLIFGYLNALERIPDAVSRIAFLDSNYAYDCGLGHKDKLVTWLKASDRHSLCVLAYNDAAALLESKPIVSAAGGTWGKSHEMQRDLAEVFPFTARTNADFERFSALEGRVQFLLKTNPERKIFHTVLVERNGFIQSLLSGTPQESQGYEYFGERAYSRWVR